MRCAGILLALALALGACDDAFEPRADDGRAVALFGTLDGRTTRQVLRVQDLAGSVLDPPDRLAATVTSTELTTGRETTWRDSLVTLPDGVRAHVVLADLAIAPGETHRIEATRDADGAVSTVTLRVPAPTVRVGPPPTPTSRAAPIVLQDFADTFSDPQVRYVVRRDDAPEALSFTARPTPGTSPPGASFLTFLDTAELRATTLLFGQGGTGDPVLLDARLEGLAASQRPVPVRDGVGGVGWAVPMSIPIPLTASAVVQAGFVDGR